MDINSRILSTPVVKRLHPPSVYKNRRFQRCGPYAVIRPMSSKCKRRLFNPKSLFQQTIHKIANTSNNDDAANYKQIDTQLPTSLYNQFLEYCIANDTDIDISESLWLSIAEKYNITSYDLTRDVVKSWTWPNITLEQSFLFKCYKWLENSPDLLDEDINIVHKTTPHFIRTNGRIKLYEDKVCVECIGKIARFSKPVDMNTSLSLSPSSSSSSCQKIYQLNNVGLNLEYQNCCIFSAENFCKNVPNNSDMWCRCCKFRPLFVFEIK